MLGELKHTTGRTRLLFGILMAMVVAACDESAQNEMALGSVFGLLEDGAADGGDTEATESNQVLNGSFDSEVAPWWVSGIIEESLSIGTGELCVGVLGGSVSPWSVMVGQGGIPLVEGVGYTFQFTATGSTAVTIKALVGEPEGEYREFSTIHATLGETPQTFSQSFVMGASDYTPQVAFQIGAGDADWTFCVDDISVIGGEAPVYEPDTGPRVRVNQVGYLPFGPKTATLVSDQVTPIAFSLMDADGEVVMTGESAPFGTDESSELDVHTIDFSGYTVPGSGYTLVADGETSYPFDIATDGYEKLRYDSLGFFYPMRSGIPIDEAIVGEGYGRPAGHVGTPSDNLVNQGDLDVPCQPAEDSALYYDEPWTCDYTLDVQGGWYDAGDPGKYVVNGGITVFQLLNAFERTKLSPTSDLDGFADGTLRIPEHNNGIPDILDEARFELEFFLKMMVPEGEPLAGMVHHKIHGNEWTQLPLLPHEDPSERWLHRPSTAATLNLSATAAQGARVFASYDPAFAAALLDAARTTWAAALAHPDLYAPEADGDDGGGAYADSDVNDEFYWAAAELYLTTGEPEFLDAVLSSELHIADVFSPGGMAWFDVAGLARIDLATIPSEIPDRDAIIASVITGAEGYLVDQSVNAFGQPYLPPDGGYPWGSNGQVLSNLVVLGAAYDLSGDEVFRQGVLKGIDYILGRNALNISYVKDFGTVSSHNMHSRWFTHALDPALPTPPAGTIAGGPNTQDWTWDPVAIRLFGNQGCAPQFCYVDDVESYATNELAINWNSALAWVASFIADQDTAEGSPYGDCEVSYRVVARCPRTGNAIALLRVFNNGKAPLKQWSLSWSHMGDQVVHRVLGAEVHQDGAMVTMSPRRRMTLRPGGHRTFVVRGNEGTLADPEPGAFFLNGKACISR